MLEPGDLYLDHNATSPLIPEVRAAIQRALELELVNPSSVHRAGERSRRELETARDAVAGLLRCEPAEVIFTSGATEANHLALFGTLAPRFAGSHVVVSAIEHSSLLDAARLLGELGASVDRVAPDRDGVVGADAMLAALRPETRLVALMAANNETGVVQPAAVLGPQLAARGIAFHVDAAPAIGRLPCDAATVHATTLAITAHKLGGPAGVGALFVRRGHRLAPFLRGGRQERALRGGTQNLLGILGFGAAAAVAAARAVDAAALPRLAEARDRFEQELRRRHPELRVTGARVPRLANTSSITLPGIDAGALLALLSRRGVHLSTGSACQAGAPEPSHVLRAMGLSAGDARATLRVSFGWEHLPEDAALAAERIAAAADDLQGGTPPD